VQLLRATDPAKDQTFFLSLVRPGSLSRVLFPVGELAKAEVRQLAAAAALSVARKRESMGVCFVGKRRSFADFLREYLPEQRPAPFLHVETGAPLRDSPQHRGAVFYTAGQRALIGNMAEPFYVARTSVAENAVWVAPGAHHPALFVREFHVDGESWLSGAAPFPHGGTLACSLRIHHRDPLRACSLSRLADGALRVELAAPASEVALGQTIAFYDGEVCLGGAQVRARGPSLYELGAWDSDALRALVGSSIAYKAQLRQAAAAAAAAAAGATPL
jgi:tRNA-specific 2-thiouridylase